MSRSIKHSPFWSVVSYFSNKKDRTIANQKMRAANKQIIRNCKSHNKIVEPDDGLDDDLSEIYPVEELDNSNFKTLREVSNTYSFASDGLPWYHNLKEECSNPNFRDYYEKFKKKIMRK